MRNYMRNRRKNNRSDYNKYQREWRRNNRDRVKVIKQRYEQKMRKIAENAKAGIINEE